jgi:hypothetical protein
MKDSRDKIDGWEMAELAEVSDTLAALIGRALELDMDHACRALAVLCDDDEGLRLSRGQPEPTATHMRLLHSRVLWITVTYESLRDGGGQRVAEVTYQGAAGDLCSARSTLAFGYDDLPGLARQRMLASGRRAVCYQLYPVPDPRSPDEGG